MDKTTKLRYYIESLCIYDLRGDDVIASLLDLLSSTDSEDVLEAQSNFFNTLAPKGPLKTYISKLILTDDNVFSKAAADGNTNELSSSIIEGVKSDLMKLEAIADITPNSILYAVEDKDLKDILWTMPRWETGSALLPLTHGWDEQTDDLADFHKENGYGQFAKFIAFEWRDHKLNPISTIDPIRLTDLKNYEIQRNQVVDNTESFVKGLPSNNVLLYGDRGTGKSSTIHAVLNEFAKDGLRMIEIPKTAIGELTVIREMLSDSPMKFIIYIDDLSFDSQDNSFTELKAALEGSLSAKQPNTLIYATSNRRHLIKENFSDRDDDINKSDTKQELLSLSDRFGLSITFMNPDKNNYLEIVEKIAEDRKLDVDIDRLFAAAEQWATKKGGRSPRCAKQFIDHVESAEKRGKEW